MNTVMDATLLRALLGAQSQLLNAQTYLAGAQGDEHRFLLARVREVNIEITRLIARAVKTGPVPTDEVVS